LYRRGAFRETGQQGLRHFEKGCSDSSFDGLIFAAERR
jgi:hypothetical protein